MHVHVQCIECSRVNTVHVHVQCIECSHMLTIDACTCTMYRV